MAKIRYLIQRLKDITQATPNESPRDTRSLVIDHFDRNMALQDVNVPQFCELEAIEMPTVFELDGLVYVRNEGQYCCLA